MYITELSSGQTPPGNRKGSGKESSRSLPRSFKLAPHSGAALTYYDITKDKLYVAKSIALICQYPYVRVAQLFLDNLFRYVNFGYIKFLRLYLLLTQKYYNK